MRARPNTTVARFALAGLVMAGLMSSPTCAAVAQTAGAAASAPAPAPARPASLVELTAANANDLLVGLQGKTFIIACSSKEASAAQAQQMALVTREAAFYAGRLPFLRLDVDKYPEVFAALSHNRKWDHGCYFFIVSNNPNYIATLSDNFNGASEALHSLSSIRLREEINNYLKLLPAP